MYHIFSIKYITFCFYLYFSHLFFFKLWFCLFNFNMSTKFFIRLLQFFQNLFRKVIVAIKWMLSIIWKIVTFPFYFVYNLPTFFKFFFVAFYGLHTKFDKNIFVCSYLRNVVFSDNVETLFYHLFTSYFYLAIILLFFYLFKIMILKHIWFLKKKRLKKQINKQIVFSHVPIYIKMWIYYILFNKTRFFSETSNLYSWSIVNFFLDFFIIQLAIHYMYNFYYYILFFLKNNIISSYWKAIHKKTSYYFLIKFFQLNKTHFLNYSSNNKKKSKDLHFWMKS